MLPNAETRVVVELVDGPIESEPILESLSDLDAGAHSLFLGKTRRRTADKETDHLVYDAYRPMALAELRRLADAAADRWQLKRVVVIHRLGRVDLGEASIAIAASSGHRREVFEAIPWLLDEIKSDVPIWKQEHWSDGLTEWVHP